MKTNSLPPLLCSALLLPCVASVQGASLLLPSDIIFELDLDSDSNWPASEGPANAIDGDPGTKYLNFGEQHSGLIISPGSSSISSFVITTANDAESRDPSSFLFFGSNDAITSADNSNGFDDNWTLLSQGSLSLPTDRGVAGTAVNVGSNGNYSSYWVVFNNTRDSGASDADSMQIGEITFYTGIDGTGSQVAPGSTAIATGWGSNIPGAEGPANLLDGDPTTKYLNFGAVNSGFEVVPSLGPTIVESFIITTANDAIDRDPTAWVLYGRAADGAWSEIDSGTLALTDDRETVGDEITVDNTDVYEAYRMVFTDLKNNTAGSMQIADIEFLGTVVPEPRSAALVLGGLAAFTLLRRRQS